MTGDKTDYERYMDGLTIKLGGVLDGAQPHDAVKACAAMIAFALKDMPEREDKLKRTVRFIQGCWKIDKEYEQARH
jgi:hypothetical protein